MTKMVMFGLNMVTFHSYDEEPDGRYATTMSCPYLYFIVPCHVSLYVYTMYIIMYIYILYTNPYIHVSYKYVCTRIITRIFFRQSTFCFSAKFAKEQDRVCRGLTEDQLGVGLHGLENPQNATQMLTWKSKAWLKGKS